MMSYKSKPKVLNKTACNLGGRYHNRNGTIPSLLYCSLGGR